jgi:hypothetical protein
MHADLQTTAIRRPSRPAGHGRKARIAGGFYLVLSHFCIMDTRVFVVAVAVARYCSIIFIGPVPLQLPSIALGNLRSRLENDGGHPRLVKMQNLT